MRVRTTLTAVLVLVVVCGLAGYLARQRFGDGFPFAGGDEECVVGDEHEVRLDSGQMANAATIAAVGIRRSLPDRALVVALATALQESKLRNLAHLGSRNDHDSVGLFQQRPSQGWGTAEKISDPRYSASRFYDALVQVQGWEQLRVTEAAQSVQRSAHPEAYQQWADEAQVLTDALSGGLPGSVSCLVSRSEATSDPRGVGALAELIHLDWGQRARSVTTSEDGVLLPATTDRMGWQFAHWMVAQAAATGVTRVTFHDREWSSRDGRWRTVSAVSTDVIALIRPSV